MEFDIIYNISKKINSTYSIELSFNLFYCVIICLSLDVDICEVFSVLMKVYILFVNYNCIFMKARGI